MHLLDMLFLNGSNAYLACMCLGWVRFTVDVNHPQEFCQALRNGSGPCNATFIWVHKKKLLAIKILLIALHIFEAPGEASSSLENYPARSINVLFWVGWGGGSISACLDYDQGFTKRCRLSWLTNSSLVYEPKCGGMGGGGCGAQPISTAVHMEHKFSKLWNSNSLFNLWSRARTRIWIPVPWSNWVWIRTLVLLHMSFVKSFLTIYHVLFFSFNRKQTSRCWSCCRTSRWRLARAPPWASPCTSTSRRTTTSPTPSSPKSTRWSVSLWWVEQTLNKHLSLFVLCHDSWPCV